jgi:hypothetical protein
MIAHFVSFRGVRLLWVLGACQSRTNSFARSPRPIPSQFLLFYSVSAACSPVAADAREDDETLDSPANVRFLPQ